MAVGTSTGQVKQNWDSDHPWRSLRTHVDSCFGLIGAAIWPAFQPAAAGQRPLLQFAHQVAQLPRFTGTRCVCRFQDHQNVEQRHSMTLNTWSMFGCFLEEIQVIAKSAHTDGCAADSLLCRLCTAGQGVLLHPAADQHQRRVYVPQLRWGQWLSGLNNLLPIHPLLYLSFRIYYGEQGMWQTW